MGIYVYDLRLVLVLCTGICCGKQCLKNDDIGWREGNIYNCTDPIYPACCEIYKQFTCCEEPNVKNVREQLQLWGSVSLIIAVLFIVYLYYNKDSHTFCICSCNLGHTCVYFFKRRCLRRKHNLDIQDNGLADKTTGTHCVLTTSRAKSEATERNIPPFQYNSFENFTVT